MEAHDREEKIWRWFGLWLRKEKDVTETQEKPKVADIIGELFTPDCIYTESWGPEYHGSRAVEHWFREWNTRGRVVAWEIRRFTHAGERSFVEWFFEDRMDNGRTERFDGVSVIEWRDGRIASLKEYGCRIPHYDPYTGEAPEVSEDEKSWF